MIHSIAEIKRVNGRFSLSFDEWTSRRNRRYMNVNLHFCNKSAGFYNLGMIRVQGSMPAEACINKLKSKLQEFGLSLDEDIVCICTDGASVMKKVGRLVSSHKVLCLLHGIQLAVIDVLYSKSHIDDNQGHVESLSDIENEESVNEQSGENEILNETDSESEDFNEVL